MICNLFTALLASLLVAGIAHAQAPNVGYHVYGFKQTCHGPTYASMKVEGNTIRLKFTDADDLRVRGGGQMRGFAIRGATGDWVWAQGKVDGRNVVLWSDKVPQPTAVRYAWAPNPVISMENGEGFPMRPFRTDKNSAQ